MRKQMLGRSSQPMASPAGDWLELEHLALAEFSSESAAHPVEAALLPGGGGWRAAEGGAQTLRLVFDQPQRLRRILLRFEEGGQPRTQEFVLRWLPQGEHNYRDLVRQQFNFSPPDTTQEIEDYRVDLDRVAALELALVPDIGGGNACASLAQLRLA